jgi:predicted Zn-dependent peptidase
MTVLRERGGLVYGAKGYSEFYEYSGEFVISTKTRTENTRKVLVLLISILKDMIRKGVSKEELEIAKGNFQGNVLLDLQDIVTQARYNGEELLFTPSHISSEAARSQRQGFSGNSIVPYKDIFETFIAPLTVKDMNRTIQQYFINQNMCVSILSEKLPSLEIVQKSTVI